MKQATRVAAIRSRCVLWLCGKCHADERCSCVRGCGPELAPAQRSRELDAVVTCGRPEGNEDE
jgi:hypothetical protein